MLRKSNSSQTSQRTGTMPSRGTARNGFPPLTAVKSPLAAAFLIVAVLFCIKFLLFVSSYQTNDDIGMTFIASGTGTTPAPDEHLRYSNVLLGLLLKTLYTHARAIPWYALFQVMVHFIATTALLYALLRREFTWRRVGLFTLYFAAIELYFLNELQFTVTAFVAGQGAIMLFLSALGEEKRRSWGTIACAVILIVLSCMVRSTSCILSVLMALPLTVVLFFDKKGDRAARMRFIVFMVLTAVVIAGLIGTNRGYFRKDSGWRDFFPVNALKSRFIDFQHTMYDDTTKPVFDAVKWSQNDYYMLLTWFYADETVYSKENLEYILAHFPKYKSYLTVNALWLRLKEIFAGGALFLLVALFFALFASGSRRNRLALAGTAVMTLLIMVMLIYTKRLPGRVYMPMFSFTAVTGLYFAFEGSHTKSYWFRLFASITGIVAVIWTMTNVTGQFNLNRVKRNANASFKQTIADLKPSPKELFVVWGATLPYEYILPFDNLDYLRDFKLISLGTTLRTPITKARMAEFGITDIYRALYENDSAYLVVRDMRYLYYYTQYVLEHYGMNIQFTTRYQTNLFTVVKPIAETNPAYDKNAADHSVIMPYR